MKFIAHYGEFGQYELARFKKLFGTPVIEAHRLLKNSVENSRYVLITDDLLEILSTKAAINFPQYLRGNKRCQAYGNIRKVYFNVFD